MKKSRNSNKKDNNKLKIVKQEKRFIMLKAAMWIFLSVPFFFIAYLYMTSKVSGDSIMDLLMNNPLTTVTLIISMINPFCGVICKQAILDLELDDNVEQVRVNLIILTFAQLIIMNFIGFGILLIALYKEFNWKQVSIKSTVQSIKSKYALTRLSLTFAVFVISGVCTFLAFKASSILS